MSSRPFSILGNLIDSGSIKELRQIFEFISIEEFAAGMELDVIAAELLFALPGEITAHIAIRMSDLFECNYSKLMAIIFDECYKRKNNSED